MTDCGFGRVGGGDNEQVVSKDCFQTKKINKFYPETSEGAGR
jgi:hypothetical protein